MKYTIVLLFSVLFLWSCKTKNIADNTNPELTDSALVLIDSVEFKREFDNKLPKDFNMLSFEKRIEFYQKTIVQAPFDQVKMTGKINIESESGIPNLDAVIYIENDQKIWANMTVFLFGAARAIVTPDGFKAIDKYNKTYIDSDFNYLNQLLNVNFINYKTVEKILMGRSFIRLNNQFAIGKTFEGFRVISLVDQKMEGDENTRIYRVEMLYNNTYDLTSLHLFDMESADELEINYQNWEAYGNIRLPKSVKIIIKGTKTSEILIENTKFDFSKIQTPYSVPNNYKKIEIQ